MHASKTFKCLALLNNWEACGKGQAIVNFAAGFSPRAVLHFTLWYISWKTIFHPCLFQIPSIYANDSCFHINMCLLLFNLI